MKLLLESDGEMTISVTLDELRLLASSIGEALEAVEDWEFQTRLGAEPATARALQAQINAAIEQASMPG
jgi:hypothetical protein